MVKVREAHPVQADGRIDARAWANQALAHCATTDKLKLINLVNALQNQVLLPPARALPHLEQGLMVAEILDNLGLDVDTLLAGAAYPIWRAFQASQTALMGLLTPGAVSLVQGLTEMEGVHARNPRSCHYPERSKHNLSNLRKLLLSVVEDIRVVLIKLALHACTMRQALRADANTQAQLALESQEIFAPLANRLGIGQVKWELEDLAFRFQAPTLYKNIARLLDERREDRERYIEGVKKEIQSALLAQNIPSQVFGRAKHIYSIWRKMQRKMLSYDQIYDVRAFRVVVPSVVDCYSALGVVHTMWQHIPQEFDDYIANPKHNGYQSLHTAVVGPSGRVLEIQIRTKQMHQQAELGVAAHWRYKEGGAHDPAQQRKLAHLRQLLSWQDELGDETETTAALYSEFFQERVYVFTPKGDVVDLPVGATAIDFAYHIHTDVGHRCRSARANGQMISLTEPLQNGVQVEIITARAGGPSRDWLNPHLGYLVTSKARAKITQWFRLQDRDSNIHNGRDMLNRELRRLGYAKLATKELIDLVPNCHSEEELLAGLGNGDIRLSQIIGALQKIEAVHTQSAPNLGEPVVQAGSGRQQRAEVLVEGTGNLLCRLARCCQPIPGDPIIGYITLGEGVSVHKANCKNILAVDAGKRMRLINCQWQRETENDYVVSLRVFAYNRIGLVKDISSVLVAESASIVSINSHDHTKQGQISMAVSIAVADLTTLGRVTTKIQQVPNVIDVFREPSKL